MVNTHGHGEHIARCGVPTRYSYYNRMMPRGACLLTVVARSREAHGVAHLVSRKACGGGVGVAAAAPVARVVAALALPTLGVEQGIRVDGPPGWGWDWGWG
jgi:hypothetical protein